MGERGRKTVVVMDDSLVVRETLAVVLAESGFAVRTAATLDELESQAGAPADLYVLDVQMPEAFGDDVGQVLRDVRRVGAPILLFSGLDEATLARRARAASLHGYVSKSAGVAALVARITALVGAPDAPPTVRPASVRPPASIPPPRPPRLGPPTVAVVDDSPLALEITRKALEAGGFSVTTASTLAELESIVQCPPDLLLLDVNMPEMFGDDVAKILKRVRKVKTPIWLFSNRPDVAGRAAHAGADGYIWKGEGMEAVVERVRAIVASAS